MRHSRNRAGALLEDFGVTDGLFNLIEPTLVKITKFAKRDEVGKIGSMDKSSRGTLLDVATKKVPDEMRDVLDGVDFKIEFKNVDGSKFWGNARYRPKQNLLLITYNTGLPLWLEANDIWQENKDRFIRDVKRTDLTLRHEVTHAVRDAQTGHLKRLMDLYEENPEMLRHYNQRGHIEEEFEIDAIVNSLDRLRDKVGYEKYMGMGLRDIDRAFARDDMPMLPSRRDPFFKKWVDRLSREDLLTDKMKREWGISR